LAGAEKEKHYMKKEHGFTLIELLIVVIILSTLSAMVGPRLVGLIGGNKKKIAATGLNGIAASLYRFEVDNERFPSTEEGLDALRSKPADCPNWTGPYLDRDPIDPWDTKFMYRYPSSEPPKDFDIWSAGADRKDGTDDDIKWLVKPK
jgi:general secretion pathway protein G